MRIKDGGNVGIGTAAPLNTLSVTGTLGVSGDASLSGDIRVADDKKLIFGAADDASLEYDEDGTDTLLYDGASLRITDDTKLEFGTGGDAHIEYNENGDNSLVISGSSVGVSISGSAVHLVTNKSSLRSFKLQNLAASTVYLAFSGSTDNEGLFAWNGFSDHFTFLDSVQLTDDKKLFLGTGNDAHIEYNEDGDDFLIVSGSSKGVALSGSSVVVDGVSTFKNDLSVADDKKVIFGTNSDAHIEYDENGQDVLIISGSLIGGLALSGSKLILAHHTVASGTIAGPGSYLAVKSTGQVVLAESTGKISAVANGANNRVATFGSADSLNGEVGLQFDGSTLDVAGDISLPDDKKLFLVQTATVILNIMRMVMIFLLFLDLLKE